MKRGRFPFAVISVLSIVFCGAVQAQVSFFQPPTYTGSGNVFVADFNGDGNLDILTSDGTMNLGNGDGTFKAGAAVSVSSGPVLAVADFNGDGKPDVLEQGTGTLLVLLGNGDGTFGPLTNVPTSGLLPIYGAGITSTIALIADMNGDGRPDIVFSPSLGIAALLNTTAPGIGVLASALSPSPVIAGNSAAATVTVSPAFGFSGTVALSCTGLPSGATCAFNPPSVANSSGTSALIISTTGGLAAGTYPLQVTGTSGSILNSMSVSLVVQAAPGFSLDGASGSPTSQTISAGQTASFGLALAPTGSYNGTVSLSCAITPSVTPAPTCTFSNSSVQISGTETQSVTVKVATTAGTTGTAFPVTLPPGMIPLPWLLLLGSAWLWVRSRKRRRKVAAPAIAMAFMFSLGCGGGSGSSSQAGTPAGTYTATITATAGSLSHNLALTVVVK